jgi:hypothetical protein
LNCKTALKKRRRNSVASAVKTDEAAKTTGA